MATYKEIKGTNIEVVSSDPSNPVEGQVWYNSTSNVLKGQAATTVGSWSTGGSFTGITRQGQYSSGTQSATFNAGGGNGSSTEGTAITEIYNGTNWTEVNDLNEAKQRGGAAGTSTSGLVFGGSPGYKDSTEIWNGSNLSLIHI